MLLAIIAQSSRELGKATAGLGALLLSWCNMDVTLPWLMEGFFSSIMTLQSIQTFLTFVRQGSWWHSASYVYLGFWFGIVHMGCINWMGSMERFSGYKESMRLDNIWTLASTMGDGWQIKGPFGADLVCLQFLATIIWSRVHSLFWAIILIVRWSPWSPYNIGFSVLYLGKFTYRKMKKKKTFV